MAGREGGDMILLNTLSVWMTKLQEDNDDRYVKLEDKILDIEERRY